MENHYLITFSGDVEKETNDTALTMYSKFNGDKTLVKVYAVDDECLSAIEYLYRDFEIIDVQYFGKKVKKEQKQYSKKKVK